MRWEIFESDVPVDNRFIDHAKAAYLRGWPCSETLAFTRCMLRTPATAPSRLASREIWVPRPRMGPYMRLGKKIASTVNQRPIHGLPRTPDVCMCFRVVPSSMSIVFVVVAMSTEFLSSPCIQVSPLLQCAFPHSCQACQILPVVHEAATSSALRVQTHCLAAIVDLRNSLLTLRALIDNGCLAGYRLGMHGA